MKNLYLYAFLLFCGFLVHSQNENNHWMIGPNHIDFSSPNISATTLTVPPVQNYPIAPAAISDDNGDLLFYFDGRSVKNKNHEIMNDLEIGISASPDYQGAIIIPHPGDQKKYYLIWGMFFAAGNVNTGNIYFYSIIDFTNNPLGEVLVLNDPDLGQQPTDYESKYTKRLRDHNGNLIDRLGDNGHPLTFTKNGNDTGYWVILGNSEKFYTYKIDPSGLNPIPNLHNFYGQIGSVGRMFRIRQSPLNINKFKLYGQGYSLDFDLYTGQLSNLQFMNMTLGNNMTIRSFELSPDYKKYYFTVDEYNSSNQGMLYVVDLTASTLIPRRLFEFNNTSVPSSQFSYIQKDRYDNLLVESTYSEYDTQKSRYIHKIENANSFLNSSIRINYLYLNGNLTSNFPAFPAFPQLFFRVSLLNCYDDLVLQSTETKSIFTYKSNSTITTKNNYVINSGSNIKLQAKDAIYLDPNTDIKNGAFFDTALVACDGGTPMAQREYVENKNYENEKYFLDVFTIYPNPSDNKVTLSLANDKIKDITLYSLDGRTVFKSQVMNNSYDIDITDYPKGIYIVNMVTMQNNVYTEKLIKN